MHPILYEISMIYYYHDSRYDTIAMWNTSFHFISKFPGITGPLMVGSGAWGRSSAILTDYCNEAAGSLTLHVELIHIPDLKEHIQKLRVGSNKRNPWFFNFWQSLCKCYIPGKGMSKPHFEEPSSTDCNVPDDNFILDSWADKTYLATYALALGVQEVCKDRGKCNVVSSISFNPSNAKAAFVQCT